MTPPPEPKGITLSIDSRLENISLVGVAVQAVCAYMGFSELDSFQIQLSVVESVNNVVKHAYGEQSGHEAMVAIKIFPDRISFQILDTGKIMESINQEKIEFPLDNRANLPEGGWGHYIIRTVMDKVAYQTVDNTNILTLDKYLPQAG
jgi:serine/threonine-protein kinase RsbW